MKTKLLIVMGLLMAAGNLFAGAFREEIGGTDFVCWMAQIEAKHPPREVAIIADDEVWFDYYRRGFRPHEAWVVVEGNYRSTLRELGKWVS